jgi:hypothetical protein
MIDDDLKAFLKVLGLGLAAVVVGIFVYLGVNAF